MSKDDLLRRRAPSRRSERNRPKTTIAGLSGALLALAASAAAGGAFVSAPPPPRCHPPRSPPPSPPVATSRPSPLRASPSGNGFGVLDGPPAPSSEAKADVEAESRPKPARSAPSLSSPSSSSSSSSSCPPPSPSPSDIKSLLLDLLPRMKGRAEEFRLIESYVNSLESAFVPAQTLGFLNLIMGGEWRFLFSTNRLGGAPSPRLRVRELRQVLDTDGPGGGLTNVARWDLAEDVESDDDGEGGGGGAGGVRFTSTGTFSVRCAYAIERGARLSVSLREHVLEPSGGSSVPRDVQGLVGMLYRAVPSEIFDPDGLGMDTTYVDGDLRIVRCTGGRLEGVRDIFVRVRDGAGTGDGD